MVQFRVSKAKALKNLVQSMWRVHWKALIKFSDDEVRISISDECSEIDALLIISARGFFNQYECLNSRLVEVYPLELSHILSLAEDDDQICAALKDESSVSYLEFRIYDSSNNEKRVENLEVRETLGENLVHEVRGHVWEASINPKYLREAIQHITSIYQPLAITITTNALTLATAGGVIRVIEEAGMVRKLDTERSSDLLFSHFLHAATLSQFELELSLDYHKESFFIACGFSEAASKTVKLKFTTITWPNPHPSFEFHISPFSKLCFHFPLHSYRNVVFLRVLAVQTLNLMLKPISTIANMAVFQFSHDGAIIYADSAQWSYCHAMLVVKAGFFCGFQCKRWLAVTVDLNKLRSVLSSLKQDDIVCIFIKDENPITRIGLHIRGSKTKKNVTTEIDAYEVAARNFYHPRLLYDYKIHMNCLKFGAIVAHSAVIKEPIKIIVTDMSVTLLTGQMSVVLSKENESACQLDQLSTQLQVVGLHAEAVITASQITRVVILSDSYAKSSNSPPLSLQFPSTPFVNQDFRFPKCVVCCQNSKSILFSARKTIALCK